MRGRRGEEENALGGEREDGERIGEEGEQNSLLFLEQEIEPSEVRRLCANCYSLLFLVSVKNNKLLITLQLYYCLKQKRSNSTDPPTRDEM